MQEMLLDNMNFYLVAFEKNIYKILSKYLNKILRPNLESRR